jgi:threonine/homoserine/homoserine lactone efflux protein
MDVSAVLEVILQLSTSPFLVGVLITFLFTLFPGPMNMVVIDQMVERGIPTGLVTLTGNCLGGCTSVFIGSLPFLFGFTLLADWIAANGTMAATIAALTMLAIGLHMLLTRVRGGGKAVYVVWAYFYTALHPGNMMVNTALVASLQAAGTLTSGWQVAHLMAGYLVGCACGWAIYTTLVAVTRGKLSDTAVVRFKRVMASLIIVAAVVTLGALYV